MSKHLNALLLLLLPLSLFGQARQYFYFSKTWNFIKYYHPDLASGKVNADSLFIAKIEKVNAHQKAGDVINLLLDGLSEGYPKQVLQNKRADLLTVNQNFNWYRKAAIAGKTKKELHAIYLNRFIGANHFYLTKEGWESMLPNEKSYEFKKDELIPLNYRLLAFAKIQGAIDYLYPYKYLMAKNFESFASKQLEQIINCKTKREFEEILLRLTAAIEDTHAFRFYNQLSSKKDIFHGMHYPPFDYKVYDNYILITDIISAEACIKAGIKPGDKIIQLNGQKVKEVIADKSKLLAASNQETLIYKLSDYISNLIWNSDLLDQNFTLLSDGVRKKSTIQFISTDNKKQISEINEYLKIKTQKVKKYETNKDFAYFKIDHTLPFIEQIKDDEIDARMDSLMKDASQKKAIVFDMRAYPDWGGFVHTYVYKYFSAKENFYYKIFFPNPDNIGTWAYQKESIHYFPDIPGKTTHSYKGQVFILVNSETLSASELYTMNLQHIFPNAITIGQQTAGADGNIKTMNLPGGYQFSFTGLCVFYPNGALTQKIGIKMDKLVPYTDQDVLSGTDKEMEKVMELLGARQP